MLCFFGLFFSLQFFLAFGWLHSLSQCFCFLSDGNTTLADFIFPLLLLSLSLNPFKYNPFPCLYTLSLTYFIFFAKRSFSPPCQFSSPSLSFLIQIRYRKDKVQSKLTPTFPLVSAVKDLSNGCAIAAVLHYYCPSLLPLEGTR